MINIDKKYYNDGIEFLAGVDEAGRGPLAGPVVAASVILPKNFTSNLIDDSKKLNEVQRQKAFALIKNNALSVSFSVISQFRIDEINILQSTLLAMKKSVQKLKPRPEIILVDGNKKFSSLRSIIAIIDGDAKSQSIAAASIVAKVIRDNLMYRLASKFPEYSWEKNKGYPTKQHIDAVKKFGTTPIHRKTFLKNILNTD